VGLVIVYYAAREAHQTLIYLISPIDLVPDVIPVLDDADDAIIVAIALGSNTRRAGPEAFQQHWPGAPTVATVPVNVSSGDRR
jgi:uncharacterized membrane protein YkvA (DUF1232 family)